jgi:hypothetical protein
MSRSCLCSRLLARAASDAAFRLLPAPARLLWFDLVTAALAAPVPGRLRFLGSVPASVSVLVSRPETDVRTDLAQLVTLGLLEIEPDETELWLPGVKERAARAEAARRNGTAGGRPRKGETPQQMRERRQGEMLLSMPGGAPADAPEKPTETKPGNPLARATTSTSLEVRSSGGSPPPPAREETPPWVSLGLELAEIAGLDPARGGYDFRPVQTWLNQGRTPDTIRAAISAAASRPGYQPGKVMSLRYFDRPVAEALHVPPPPPRQTSAEREAERAEIERIDRENDALAYGYPLPSRRAA